MSFGRKRTFLAILIVGATVGGSAGSAAASRPELSLGLQQELEAGVATTTSTNWAGYAITDRKPFTSATGRWVQPAVSCADLSPTYSAFWVGLGGYSGNSLEQIGTETDCTANGRATCISFMHAPERFGSVPATRLPHSRV